MKKYLILFTLILIQGCSSDDGGSAPATKVNLIGSWDRVVYTQNGICDGLFPQSIETFSANGADTTLLGVITIQGEEFDVDSFGNCSLVTTTITSNDWIGRPAEQTASEFLNYVKQDNAGDNTIQELRLDSFTDNKIVGVNVYTNGVIITFTLTR